MTGFKKDGVEQTLFSTGLDNLAGEGWHIQKINGYYYILHAESGTEQYHCEVAARSRNIFGLQTANV